MIKDSTDSGETIEIPLNFGKYSYVRKIGVGSYSVVVLVTNNLTKEACACKIMTRAGLQADGAMKRFIQEIDIMQSLKHPNIVDILDIIYTTENVYVITEYCQNGELFDFIISRPNLSYEDVRKLFFQVVYAVFFLHQKKIAHRDIKPENILLDQNFNVKLADFGFSRQVDENNLMSTPCGSQFYAAPEIIKGLAYDGQKSDIWSLGVLLFAISTKSLPWTAASQPGIIFQIFNAQYDIPACVSKDIADCIDSCLRLEPNERPTAFELLQSNFLKSLTDQSDLQEYFQRKIQRPATNFATNSLVSKKLSFVQPHVRRNMVSSSIVYKQQINKKLKRPIRNPGNPAQACGLPRLNQHPPLPKAFLS